MKELLVRTEQKANTKETDGNAWQDNRGALLPNRADKTHSEVKYMTVRKLKYPGIY